MENIVFRKLNENDWDKGYFDLLKQLTEAKELDKDRFKEILKNIEKTAEIYIYEDVIKGKIIASATLMIEQKFIRNGGKVGHLEDVVVDVQYRGLSLGKELISKIINLASEKGCYKLIGNCNSNLIGFYEKNGFSNKGIQIGIYFNL